MQYQANKLITDEFGRVSGILAVNKPVGITSHDVVDKVRRAFKMSRVGHAGALDPFASGVLLILLGKLTKDSDQFLQQPKEYVANILFGISTDSADPEGKVLQARAVDELPDLQPVLAQFSPSYTQFVPIFSSVKVKGEKLRVLARQAESVSIQFVDGKKVATFKLPTKEVVVEVPQHVCQIPEIELLQTGTADIRDSQFYVQNQAHLAELTTFPTAQIRVACSKGTYIRALAEDIGSALSPTLPAMLWELQRTKVGDITLEQCIEVDELESMPAL